MKQHFKTFSQKRRCTILADSENISLQEDVEVDVILSPRYYWAKKQDLPVKQARAAKAYAKASFEGFIPQGEYSYLAKKCDEGFWLYAYDDRDILDRLKSISINPSQVRRVYFAQNELKNLQTPIKVNQQEALINHNGTIIQVPLKMVDRYIGLSEYLKDNPLSKFYFTLNKFSQIIAPKKAYLIMFLLLCLVGFYGVELIWLNGELNAQMAKKELIGSRYHMPRTSIQTRAIIKRLDKKISSQLKMRDGFYALLKMPMKEGEYVKDISYKNDAFKIFFHGQNSQNIENYLKKHFASIEHKSVDKMQMYEVKK